MPRLVIDPKSFLIYYSVNASARANIYFDVQRVIFFPHEQGEPGLPVGDWP
jgi:hypothetical protein